MKQKNMNMKVFSFFGGAHFLYTLYCVVERKVDETDKNGVMKPKRRVFFKSQVDHEKSHLALARWNVVL